MVTGWRDFLAAPPRVESVVSPFNVRILCHCRGIVALQSFAGELFIQEGIPQLMKDSMYVTPGSVPGHRH